MYLFLAYLDTFRPQPANISANFETTFKLYNTISTGYIVSKAIC